MKNSFSQATEVDVGKSQVVFMCGPAGAGKTTVSMRLQTLGFTRLSFDDAAWGAGYTKHPLPDEVHQEIKAHLDARLRELLAAGKRVVLDYSFWSVQMRQEYRGMVSGYGIVPLTIYLKTPRDIALSRVEQRQGAHPGEVQLEPEIAQKYFDHFQVPTPEEGPLIVLEPRGATTFLDK